MKRYYLMPLFILFLVSCAVASRPYFERENFSALGINEIIVVDSDFAMPSYAVKIDAWKNGDRIEGMAYKSGIIYIIGRKRPDGTLNISNEVLGHEVKHFLHWKYPMHFVDPDRER